MAHNAGPIASDAPVQLPSGMNVNLTIGAVVRVFAAHLHSVLITATWISGRLDMVIYLCFCRTLLCRSVHLASFAITAQSLTA